MAPGKGTRHNVAHLDFQGKDLHPLHQGLAGVQLLNKMIFHPVGRQQFEDMFANRVVDLALSKYAAAFQPMVCHGFILKINDGLVRIFGGVNSLSFALREQLSRHQHARLSPSQELTYIVAEKLPPLKGKMRILAHFVVTLPCMAPSKAKAAGQGAGCSTGASRLQGWRLPAWERFQQSQAAARHPANHEIRDMLSARGSLRTPAAER